MLEVSDAELESAQDSLADSDAGSAAKSTDLLAAQKALAASDSKLVNANKQLAETAKKLAAANTELRSRGNIQKEFINIAAHELRTPIQPIIATMELLGFYPARKAEEEEEEVRVKLSEMKLIARNAIRLERLSTNILDASRIESGKLSLHMRIVNLGEVAYIALENSRHHANKRGVKFTIDTSDSILVNADEERIMEVFSNLINNAIKATPEGVIAITVSKKDTSSLVTVRDTGAGIDSDIMSRLFMKFTTKTDGGNGTGLGLYISKAIIEAHDGKIWAENNDDGKGASFHFTLPVNRSIDN